MDEAAPTVDRAGKARELLQKLRFMKGSEPKERHAEIDAAIKKASSVVDEEEAKASADAEGNDVGYGEAAMRLGGEAVVPFLHRYVGPLAAGLGSMYGGGKFSEGYEPEQKEQLDRLAKTREQHQLMDMGADIAGMMFGPSAKIFRGVERIVKPLAAPARGLAQDVFVKGTAGGAGVGAYNAIKKFGSGEHIDDSLPTDIGKSLKAGADAAPAGAVGGALVPGGPGILGPLETAAASGVAGAAVDSGDAVMHGEDPLRTVDIGGYKVPSMLVSAIANAVVPTASSFRHDMIRNPKTDRGVAMAALENPKGDAGKMTVLGPELSPGAKTRYGARPVSEEANATTRAATKEHYDQDLADHKGFRKREKADSHGPQLPATEEQVRALLSTAQGQRAWKRVLKTRAEDAAAPERFEESRGTVKRTLVDQPSFDPDLATTKTETPAFMSEVVGEGRAEPKAEPGGDSSIWDELQYEPKNTQRRVKTPAEVELSSTKREMPTSMAELTGGAEPAASKKPAKGRGGDEGDIPQTLDARDVADLTRVLRDKGKVGKPGNSRAQRYKEQSARASEILSEIDPEGHGARMKEEGEQLSRAEERNEALGLQRKSKIKPSPKKRELVAARLASLDTAPAARQESIDIAESLSPTLRERLPRLRGLQGYEHLRFGGTPLRLHVSGGGLTDSINLNTASKLLARLDPAIAGAERRNLAPSLLMESLHLGHKKKKSDEKEKQND